MKSRKMHGRQTSQAGDNRRLRPELSRHQTALREFLQSSHPFFDPVGIGDAIRIGKCNNITPCLRQPLVASGIGARERFMNHSCLSEVGHDFPSVVSRVRAVIHDEISNEFLG